MKERIQVINEAFYLVVFLPSLPAKKWQLFLVCNKDGESSPTPNGTA